MPAYVQHREIESADIVAGKVTDTAKVMPLRLVV